MTDIGSLAVVVLVVTASTCLGFLLSTFLWSAYNGKNPKYLYCARCNKMIGAQDVSTPPYSTPASPTPVHDQNMNFQHTQNKQVPRDVGNDQLDQLDNSQTWERLGIQGSSSNIQLRAPQLEVQSFSGLQESPPNSKFYCQTGLEKLTPSGAGGQDTSPHQVSYLSSGMSRRISGKSKRSTPLEKGTPSHTSLDLEYDENKNNQVRVLGSPDPSNLSCPTAKTPGNASGKRPLRPSGSVRSRKFHRSLRKEKSFLCNVQPEETDLSDAELLAPLLGGEVENFQPVAKKQTDLLSPLEPQKDGNQRNLGSPGNTTPGSALAKLAFSHVQMIDIDSDKPYEPESEKILSLSTKPTSLKKVRKTASVRSTKTTIRKYKGLDSDLTSQSEDERGRAPLKPGKLALTPAAEEYTSKDFPVHTSSLTNRKPLGKVVGSEGRNQLLVEESFRENRSLQMNSNVTNFRGERTITTEDLPIMENGQYVTTRHKNGQDLTCLASTTANQVGTNSSMDIILDAVHLSINKSDENSSVLPQSSDHSRLGPSSPVNGILNESALVTSVQQYSSSLHMIPQRVIQVTQENPSVHNPRPMKSQPDMQNTHANGPEHLTFYPPQMELNRLEIQTHHPSAVPDQPNYQQALPVHTPCGQCKDCSFSTHGNYFNHPANLSYDQPPQRASQPIQGPTQISYGPQSSPYYSQPTCQGANQQTNHHHISPHGSISGYHYHSSPQTLASNYPNVFNYEHPYKAPPYPSASQVPPSTPDPTINSSRKLSREWKGEKNYYRPVVQNFDNRVLMQESFRSKNDICMDGSRNSFPAQRSNLIENREKMYQEQQHQGEAYSLEYQQTRPEQHYIQEHDTTSLPNQPGFQLGIQPSFHNEVQLASHQPIQHKTVQNQVHQFQQEKHYQFQTLYPEHSSPATYQQQPNTTSQQPSIISSQQLLRAPSQQPNKVTFNPLHQTNSHQSTQILSPQPPQKSLQSPTQTNFQMLIRSPSQLLPQTNYQQATNPNSKQPSQTNYQQPPNPNSQQLTPTPSQLPTQPYSQQPAQTNQQHPPDANNQQPVQTNSQQPTHPNFQQPLLNPHQQPTQLNSQLRYELLDQNSVPQPLLHVNERKKSDSENNAISESSSLEPCSTSSLPCSSKGSPRSISRLPYSRRAAALSSLAPTQPSQSSDVPSSIQPSQGSDVASQATQGSIVSSVAPSQQSMVWDTYDQDRALCITSPSDPKYISSDDRGSNDSVFEKTMLTNVNALEEKGFNQKPLDEKVRRIQGESIGRLDSMDEVETESDFEILELKECEPMKSRMELNNGKILSAVPSCVLLQKERSESVLTIVPEMSKERLPSSSIDTELDLLKERNLSSSTIVAGTDMIMERPVESSDGRSISSSFKVLEQVSKQNETLSSFVIVPEPSKRLESSSTVLEEQRTVFSPLGNNSHGTPREHSTRRLSLRDEITSASKIASSILSRSSLLRSGSTRSSSTPSISTMSQTETSGSGNIVNGMIRDPVSDKSLS